MTKELSYKRFGDYFCQGKFGTEYTQLEMSLTEFWIAGINYRKTDATLRGKYAINNQQYSDALNKASAHGLNELFILSTCNRTEIYGMAKDANQLINVLCSQTEGDDVSFKQRAYIKNGISAVEHLFSVSAGLDSQVLGDYEILGQMKTAASFAKKHGFIGSFSERLLNSALQSSKAIKTNTKLSGGTVSVSFATIQLIKDIFPEDFKSKKILLLGTGKIGKSTCKNLVDYLHTHNITLVNRTAEKAEAIATELGLKFAPAEQMQQEIAKADIIITSTNATAPIISRKDLEGHGEKLLIDLSIPYNVDQDVCQLEGVRLFNVDELAKLKDKTLQERMSEVPKAKELINKHITDFTDWYSMRQRVPVLKALKQKLHQMQDGGALQNDAPTNERIKKIISNTALKVKKENKGGCHYIEALNDFFAFG